MAQEQSGLTRRVWQLLAEADQAMTPAQVRAALGGELAYTTVMTVLVRLVGQGVATRERVGRAYAYTAVDDDAELTARQMSRLLDTGGDRAAVLARFVDVISEADEELLGELLRPPQSGQDEP